MVGMGFIDWVWFVWVSLHTSVFRNWCFYVGCCDDTGDYGFMNV